MEAAKVFSICLLSILLLNQVQGWVALGNYHNDAHPGKCTVTDQLILEPGQTAKSPEGCSEISCISEDGMANVVGCAAAGARENCEWGDYIDEAADYPKCCERHEKCRNN